MLIFLTGMPGSGKTYWMRRLSAALRYNGVDLDQYITQYTGCSIPALFSVGEDWFRKKEKEALADLLGRHTERTVVATGGGTPCFFDNLELMKAHGLVIYLRRTVAQLAHNLSHSTETRPLLQAATTPASLNHLLSGLLAQRTAAYQQSHYVLDSTDLSLEDFTNIILNKPPCPTGSGS